MGCLFIWRVSLHGLCVFCNLSLYLEVLTSRYKYYHAESLYLSPGHSLLVSIKFFKISALVLCLISFFLNSLLVICFWFMRRKKPLASSLQIFQGCFTPCEALPTGLSGSAHILTAAWNCYCKLFFS